MKKTTKDNLIVTFVFLGLLGLISGSFFFFKCSNEYCASIDFDTHGLPNIFYWVIWFILMEISFGTFCWFLKKEKKDSWISFIAFNKIVSCLVALMLLIIIPGIFFLFIKVYLFVFKNISSIILQLLIIAGIGIIFVINYIIGKQIYKWSRGK